ncbi:hypothetical protein CIB48_g10462 [Xylaria polymorpha]|nr:hypothetical protein CIB48_g10462 [Xylaria polymorpha]
MDSSGMDFTMRHPNHHHPHYEQSNGASSSAAAARCPAFRVAAEQGNYQRPTISPARSSVQYEPGHRNLWQSRSPQNWRPAMISPYTQDSSGMGTFSAVASNQPVQSQQPLCPMPVNSNAPNVSEAYTPQIAALQQFRPTMHPAPRLLATTQSSPDVHNTEPPDVTFSPTPEPATQATGPVEDGSSRPASHSPSGPASTAPHRTNDQPGRMTNPVEIRRASTAAIGRARRSIQQRYAAAPSEWLGESAALLRRDMSLVEFSDGFPGAISDGEGAMSGRFLRGHGSGKRVASKQALASLQSVNIADLPETCVICYNEFGVANPEGINEAPLRLPKCKHVFGDHCIKKWFQESDSCPYCRDKVPSEAQPMPPRRYPGFRFIPPYPITAQHLPGYQGHNQNQSRDRDVPELESSTQSGHSMANNNTDRTSSEFGGPTSNGASQTSVRSSRSSRSRSPVEYAGFGMDLSNRRSLTNSPEQHYWNDSSSNNSSQSGGATRASPSSGSVFDLQSYPVQPQMVNFPDDTFFNNRSISANEIAAMQSHEHPPGLPQMHPGLRFSSPPTGSLGSYVPISSHVDSNQFTSYQQS